MRSFALSLSCAKQRRAAPYRESLLPRKECADRSHDPAPQVDQYSLPCDSPGRSGLEFRVRGSKELPKHHLGRAFDYALADLHERSPHLHIAGIFDHRRGAIARFEVERAGAAHEALLAFAVHEHFVVLRWTLVFDLELPGVDAFDRRDPDIDGSAVFVGAQCLELFASGEKP